MLFFLLKIYIDLQENSYSVWNFENKNLSYSVNWLIIINLYWWDILMELLELSGLEQCHYNMTKRGVCVCASACTCMWCACVQATWHSKSKEMSQKLLTFCWHLWSVAIWEPYDCWQIGVSAQACKTWPHWAQGLSVYRRNTDTSLTALFLCRDILSFPNTSSPSPIRWKQPQAEIGHNVFQ